jgi:tetratricopeptide (TPR) repeat protein
MAHETTLDPALDAAIKLQQSGRLAEARAIYEGFLETHPENPEALHLLGMTCAQLGDSRTGVACMRRAVEMCPDNPDFTLNLANLLEACDLEEEAVQCLQALLSRGSDNATAHLALADKLQNLGRFEEAEEQYEKALALNPGDPAALTGLGMVMRSTQREDAAEASYRMALQTNPNQIGALINLALLIMSQGRHDEAQECIEKSLALAPDNSKTWFHLGNAMLVQNRAVAAQNAFKKTISLAPDDPEGHTHLGLACLLAGDLVNGFAEYEWRLKIPNIPIDPLPGPAWDGSPLDGAWILLHAEQGYGDTLQCVRYVSMVAGRGGRVALRCQWDLGRLLENAPGVERIESGKEVPQGYDVHAHLMSLPHIFGTSLDTVPADVPYLAPAKDLVDKWAKRLGNDEELKVGLAWRGSPSHPNDKNRSSTPSIFLPLLGRPGVRFFSLQKGVHADDLPLPEGIEDVTDGFEDFSDTAACVSNLDLIISVDTAVIHLAGALASPVWVMLPVSSDWRWMLDRDDSPWYPTMRLFWQRRWDDWDEVVDRIGQSLDAFKREKGR